MPRDPHAATQRTRRAGEHHEGKPIREREQTMERIYYPLNDEQARIAHDMNSFRPFRSDEEDYRASVDEAYAAADEVAEQMPERAERVYALADRFAKKYAEWLNKSYRIASMCPSIMVAGPANFPMKKKDKQNRARDNHLAELQAIIAIKERIEEIGYMTETIKAGDADAVEKLEAKIERLRAEHEAMKNANRGARAKGEKAPYPSFSIANSNKRIRDAEQRLASIKAAKEAGSEKREAEFMGEPVEIVENAELMRLQLIFEGKPSEEIRAKLKGHGFRWSPKNGAWQRQLTNNARFALRCMMEDAA